MWVVVHVCSGLALGSVLHAPLVVVLSLSLLLHAVLDLVPHWDYTGHHLRRLWAGLDLGIAGLLTALLWPAWGLTAGVILTGWVSALPDLDVLNEVLPLERRRRLFPSHWVRFPHGRCTARWGIPIQVAVVAASLVILRLTSAWP